MELLRVPVDDGSTLVLVGVPPDLDDDAPRPAEVLGPVSDFLQDLVVNGLVFGLVGNASYEMLKTLALLLRDRGMLVGAPAAGADDVCDRVAQALDRAGHAAPVIDEIAQYADKGWGVSGTVGTRTFTAHADDKGQVIHLRVT